MNGVGLLIKMDQKIMFGVFDGLICGRINEFKEIPNETINKHPLFNLKENEMAVVSVAHIRGEDYNINPLFNIPLKATVKDIHNEGKLFILVADLYVKYIRPEIDKRFPGQMRVEFPIVLN